MRGLRTQSICPREVITFSSSYFITCVNLWFINIVLIRYTKKLRCGKPKQMYLIVTLFGCPMWFWFWWHIFEAFYHYITPKNYITPLKAYFDYRKYMQCNILFRNKYKRNGIFWLPGYNLYSKAIFIYYYYIKW